jgi:glycosyltransferase involved in cell wall biosynthesis
VRCMGFKPALECLPECDMVVVCSRADGRPNIIMESLAMGIPVIASRVGSIPELAPDGQGAMLCEAEDVEAFTTAVASLADDPGRRAELGAAGRRWAEQHFSIVDAGRQYQRLFHQSHERVAPQARPVRTSEILTASSVSLQIARRLYRMSREAFLRGV